MVGEEGGVFTGTYEPKQPLSLLTSILCCRVIVVKFRMFSMLERSEQDESCDWLRRCRMWRPESATGSGGAGKVPVNNEVMEEMPAVPRVWAWGWKKCRSVEVKGHNFAHFFSHWYNQLLLWGENGCICKTIAASNLCIYIFTYSSLHEGQTVQQSH